MKKSIEVLEKRHPDLLFTDSEQRGVHYITGEDDRICILVRHKGKADQTLVLNLSEAYAISQELKGMLVLVGRKKVDPHETHRGRPKKYAM